MLCCPYPAALCEVACLPCTSACVCELVLQLLPCRAACGTATCKLAPPGRSNGVSTFLYPCAANAARTMSALLVMLCCCVVVRRPAHGHFALLTMQCKTCLRSAQLSSYCHAAMRLHAQCWPRVWFLTPAQLNALQALRTAGCISAAIFAVRACVPSSAVRRTSCAPSPGACIGLQQLPAEATELSAQTGALQ